MQTVFRIFLAFLLAHLLADFPLQSEAMVVGKKQGCALFYVQHAAIHLVVLLGLLRAFTNLSLGSWNTLLLVSYVVIHVACDVMKTWLVKRRGFRDSAGLFLLDQAFHLATIVAMTWVFTRVRWTDIKAAASWTETKQLQVLLVAVLYVVVIFGGGYLVRYLTRSLTVQLPRTEGGSPEELRNAGLYIGWLERFLILTAVMVQSPALIGLILTGKSIARLPELKGPRFAEYFLIGTFLSISLALVGGIVLSRLLFGTSSLK
ncbi:MAG: DUF3307 domain-containing protein [Acidobacteriota bacterium]|nr:DUF3307 domain-containing protein [Acidobacteriota bacterium]